MDELHKVVWRDAFGSTDVQVFDLDDVKAATSYIVTTYGILVRDDRDLASNDRLVAVAAERLEDGEYRGVTFIPAEMVVSIEPVTAVRKRRGIVRKRATAQPSTSPPQP